MAEQGKAFELEIKDRLEFEIQNGLLGILPECARVFHRKAYFSQHRQKPIVIDVVIELYRPGATEPFLLWVWECKDYQHKVPVDDIEEFHAKIEQIKLHTQISPELAPACSFIPRIVVRYPRNVRKAIRMASLVTSHPHKETYKFVRPGPKMARDSVKIAPDEEKVDENLVEI